MIRDRIVVGVVDGELSKKLQLTPKISVTKAVEMVRTYEDVQQQHKCSAPSPILWSRLIRFGHAAISQTLQARAAAVEVITTGELFVQLRMPSVTSAVSKAIMLLSATHLAEQQWSRAPKRAPVDSPESRRIAHVEFISWPMRGK